ncbi:lectin-like domain-containing protein, partial [Enterococcus cecorum]|uniref:lectin-like domain-containing protein n=3 Tax=Enterococcus cecorum TaxID=44008 RepID=UPI0032C48669
MFYQKKEKQFKYAIKKKKGGGGAASFIIGCIIFGSITFGSTTLAYAEESQSLTKQNEVVFDSVTENSTTPTKNNAISDTMFDEGNSINAVENVGVNTELTETENKVAQSKQVQSELEDSIISNSEAVIDESKIHDSTDKIEKVSNISTDSRSNESSDKLESEIERNTIEGESGNLYTNVEEQYLNSSETSSEMLNKISSNVSNNEQDDISKVADNKKGMDTTPVSKDLNNTTNSIVEGNEHQEKTVSIKANIGISHTMINQEKVENSKNRFKRSRPLDENNSTVFLGDAKLEPKAKLIVEKKNMMNYFLEAGSARSDSYKLITLTEDLSGQAGSFQLINRIDMNESFRLEGKLNLGNKYEGYTISGRAGGDGVAAVFTTSLPGVVGLPGASIGIGGIPNSFGFKLDTWHNTSTPNNKQKASADPKFIGYNNGAFGAFYSTDGSGKAITLKEDAKKLINNPKNNDFLDFIVEYNGETKDMTINYGGQIFSRNITDYLDKSRLTTGQSVGSEELAFAIFGSTGAGTNLQQFDLTRFEYTAGGSYIAIKYIDDVTGEEIRTEKIIQGDPGTQKDLSDDITLAGYIQKRTNINTSQGYMDGNTLQFVKGIQTLTYTYIAVNKEILTNLVEESSQIKASQKYLYSSSNKKVEYDMVIEMGKKVLSNIDATQTDVDNAVETIEQARNGLDGQLIIDKTEEAVKAAEDAGKAGADKKAEVETDGLVTPDEKAAVDGMNDTTTAKKEEASQLVDALPEGPVKDSLKARLDQVVTSEVTVNDADSNGKADDVDAA